VPKAGSVERPVPVCTWTLIAAVTKCILVDFTEVAMPREEGRTTMDWTLVRMVTLDRDMRKLTVIVELEVDVTKVIVQSTIQPATRRFRLEANNRVEIALLVLGFKLSPFDSLARAFAVLGSR
jgi:hypothetical protein